MGNSRRLRRTLGAGVVAVGVAAATAAMTAGPVQAQEGKILNANTAGAVDGSYIVVLKDNAVQATGVQAKQAVHTEATTLAAKYNSQVKHTYSSALEGFSVHASEADAKRMAADGNVAYVSQSHRFHTDAVSSWGLDRVDQPDLPLDDTYTPANDGKGVTAYIVDTGVDGKHPAFGDRVKGGKDFVDNDDDPTDQNGHGTHVAGTIGSDKYGLAAGVTITPVRVLDANGSGTTEGVVAGVDWVTQNHQGPSVANMSLGGPPDQALDDAVKGAIDSGVTFGVAAGNESADASTSSPARLPEAITVAASTIKDAQADFSNFGKLVDIYAPGEDITSAWLDGGENTISGTSMATPHVVGVAAEYLSAHPDAAPADVAKALTDGAAADKITNASPDTANKLLQLVP